MKLTPSLAGLILETIALALILALLVLGKESWGFFYITAAAVAVYIIAAYHFTIGKPQKSFKRK